MLDKIRAHIGSNQDAYIWPLVLILICVSASEIVFMGSGRKPLADMAVNLESINAYALLNTPIFCSLLWASLAGRFLGWTFKSYETWLAAEWGKQALDLIIPVTVFVTCMVYFSTHS